MTDALPYIKNDNNYLAAANNFFGIADKELSNYNDAIFYYNEAINDSKDLLSKEKCNGLRRWFRFTASKKEYRGLP